MSHRILTCLLGLALCAPLTASEAYDSYDGDYSADDGRPMLGVVMTPPSGRVIEEKGLQPNEGVLVRKVYPGTTAAEMGLKPGDVITEINGTPIDSMQTLREVIQGSYIGDDITVKTKTDGGETINDGFLGEWPEKVTYNPIDQKAEERYRDLQLKRIARREQQISDTERVVENLDKEIAAAQRQLAAGNAPSGAGSNGGNGTQPAAAAGMPSQGPKPSPQARKAATFASAAVQKGTPALLAMPSLRFGYKASVSEESFEALPAQPVASKAPTDFRFSMHISSESL